MLNKNVKILIGHIFPASEDIFFSALHTVPPDRWRPGEASHELRRPATGHAKKAEATIVP